MTILLWDVLTFRGYLMYSYLSNKRVGFNKRVWRKTSKVFLFEKNKWGSSFIRDCDCEVWIVWPILVTFTKLGNIFDSDFGRIEGDKKWLLIFSNLYNKFRIDWWSKMWTIKPKKDWFRKGCDSQPNIKQKRCFSKMDFR